MDLSNVIFITNDRPTRVKGQKKGGNSKAKKERVKKVQLKERKSKHGKPHKRGEKDIEVLTPKGLGSRREKPRKSNQKERTDVVHVEKLCEQHHWNKMPPKDGEPKTKSHRGKIYHWCPHCNYWALHKPGKGKKCQAVDPLAHLLNYFGCQNKTATQKNAGRQSPTNSFGDISMDDTSL